MFFIVNFDVIVNLSPSPVQDPTLRFVTTIMILLIFLAQNESVITNGEPGVVVTYHETIMDAQNDINQINEFTIIKILVIRKPFIRVEKATTVVL